MLSRARLVERGDSYLEQALIDNIAMLEQQRETTQRARQSDQGQRDGGAERWRGRVLRETERETEREAERERERERERDAVYRKGDGAACH